MLRNYLNVAFRNLFRQRVHSLINITGLSVGIAACLVIMLYVRYELSFENVHTDADRIYRVNSFFGTSGIQENLAVTPNKVVGFAQREAPEVEAATRIFGFRSSTQIIVKQGERAFYETDVMVADQGFFEVFPYAFISGTPQGALDAKEELVITRSMAMKYFDRVDVAGQALNLNGTDYSITGVIEDIPDNTNIKFDMIYSMLTFGDWANEEGWFPMNYNTFVKLVPEAKVEGFMVKLNERLDEELGESLEAEGTTYYYESQPLKDIHYNTTILNDYESNVDKNMIYAFLLIATFILVIACINYINLSTARSERRAKEVGLRKVLGAHKSQLMWQFYGETLLVTLIAVVLAVVMAELFLPYFNDITGLQLDIQYFQDRDVMYLLGAILLVISLLAGSYPATFLSSFQPIKVLKSTFNGVKGGNVFRKVLVVIQFSVSVFLIIGTLVIYLQLNYVNNKDLGYDEEQTIVMSLSDRTARQRFKTLKSSFETINGVEKVAFANQMITNVVSGWRAEAEGLPSNKSVSFVGLWASKDLPETVGLKMKYGNGFTDVTDIGPDRENYYIINETGARAVGFEPSEAVGKEFGLAPGMMGRVVGVVEDFHFGSLHQKIEPMSVFMGKGMQEYMMYLKVDMKRFDQVVASLEDSWDSIVPERPMEFDFLSEKVAALYEKDRKTAQILILFTILSVSIGCLGLFGLAAFMAQKRTKEIGIRKVLGADMKRIVSLLSREYVQVIMLSNLIAWPLGYLVMNNWLDTFSYRIGLSWYIFVLAGSITVMVALVTVSYQSVRAALSNPIKALRYE